MFGRRSHSPRSAWTPSDASLNKEALPEAVVDVVLRAWDDHRDSWGNSADALTDWLNARWTKTGVQVTPEAVCFTLRAAGRDARMGVPDCKGGRFLRESVEWGGLQSEMGLR
ncbi:hypothetical protein Slin14017_G107600 [Septoria linicola]|nr:hypothetical protein Slin14017_G107600 [Septoria linicola]